MADSIELDLQTDESVSLDLVDTEVSLDVQDVDITLEVVGQVGPRGPSGINGGFFRWSQPVAATQWSFTHDLEYPPAITVVDSAGTVLYGDVTYVDDFTITIDFSFPTAGYAYLS